MSNLTKPFKSVYLPDFDIESIIQKKNGSISFLEAVLHINQIIPGDEFDYIGITKNNPIFTRHKLLILNQFSQFFMSAYLDIFKSSNTTNVLVLFEE